MIFILYFFLILFTFPPSHPHGRRICRPVARRSLLQPEFCSPPKSWLRTGRGWGGGSPIPLTPPRGSPLPPSPPGAHRPHRVPPFPSCISPAFRSLRARMLLPAQPGGFIHKTTSCRGFLEPKAGSISHPLIIFKTWEEN